MNKIFCCFKWISLKKSTPLSFTKRISQTHKTCWQNFELCSWRSEMCLYWGLGLDAIIWPCPRVQYLISQPCDRIGQCVCVSVSLKRMVWLSISSGYSVKLFFWVSPPFPTSLSVSLSLSHTHTHTVPTYHWILQPLAHCWTEDLGQGMWSWEIKTYCFSLLVRKWFSVILERVGERERDKDMLEACLVPEWGASLRSASPPLLLPACPHRAEL